MGAHETGLSIVGDREQGQDVRSANVTAVMTLCNILKTSLGPQGLDKMVVDDIGDVTVTNDGATILQKLEIQHPAAKVLVELADLQDREVGDGTTSVVIVAAELLRRANELVKQHIHPTNVIAGFRLAMKACVKYIQEHLAVKVADLGEDTLQQIAATTLNSKFVGADGNFFAKLVVDAVQSVKMRNAEGKWKFPVNQINVIRSHGKSSSESQLIADGYAIQMQRVAQGCPTRVEKAKVALLDFDLKKFTMRAADIVVSDPKELEKIRQKEMDITRDRLKAILDTGANVILTAKGMDDMSIKYLVEAGAMGLRRVERSDMKRIAKATGAKIQLTLANLEGGESFDKESLGYCDLVEETRVGDNDFIFFRGTAGAEGEALGSAAMAAFDPPSRAATKAKASTILLRGANEYMLEETERSLHDALMAVSKTCESQYVVPGGGAVETALSLYLEEYAATLTSREQLAVSEFAEALLTIPTVLTCNAALDAIDLTSKLRVAHHTARQAEKGMKVHTGAFKNMSDPCKGKFYGLDLVNNDIQNSIENGVLEPMISKLKSLKFATEAAITIIRIDDLIKLAPEQQQ